MKGNEKMSGAVSTKQAIASAFRGLVERGAVSRISISDICAECGVNRKSFYYHFKDKQDLVCWIFDTEFISCTVSGNTENGEDGLLLLLEYLDRERAFYRKIICERGQNSLQEHFREIFRHMVRERLGEIAGETCVSDFQVSFMLDGIIGAIERWLQCPKEMQGREFLLEIKQCLSLAEHLFSADSEASDGECGCLTPQ